MKLKAFSPLIVATLLFALVLFLPEKWLISFVNDRTVEKAATNLDTNMFQGYIIQNKMLKDPKYLPIFGSSELSRMDPFHPSNYFKANPMGFTPFLVGKGGTESLSHFLNFSVHANELKNKKIIFILSPQWFVKEGLNESHFAPNFSVLQGYQFALNPKVDHKLVVEGSKRLLSYEVVKKDIVLSSLLKANIYHDKIHQTKAMLVKPFAHTFLRLLERRDLILSLMEPPLKKPHPNYQLTKGRTWGHLNIEASNMAKRKSNSNHFYVDNLYYKTMLKPKMKTLKNYKRKASYAVSPQYSDLQMVMDVLKETGAKPLFVSIPVNGYFSDYTGFPKEGRTLYYQKVRKQIEDNGFPVLDLTNNEYNKYFFTDTIHLGYKGWIAIDKGIEQFEKE
jgi:D-alanine transfer protein